MEYLNHHFEAPASESPTGWKQPFYHYHKQFNVCDVFRMQSVSVSQQMWTVWYRWKIIQSYSITRQKRKFCLYEKSPMTLFFYLTSNRCNFVLSGLLNLLKRHWVTHKGSSKLKKIFYLIFYLIILIFSIVNTIAFYI